MATKEDIILRSENQEGTVHSYSQEEKMGIVEHINFLLKGDPQISHIIPINIHNEDIFKSVNDGVLLW
jgi:hypothetical protein